jgi:hypothetical protein
MLEGPLRRNQIANLSKYPGNKRSPDWESLAPSLTPSQNASSGAELGTLISSFFSAKRSARYERSSHVLLQLSLSAFPSGKAEKGLMKYDFLESSLEVPLWRTSES